MKIKRYIALLLIFIMTMLLCACQSNDAGKSEDKSVEGKKIQIGMSFDSFVIERWQRDRDVFVSMAK